MIFNDKRKKLQDVTYLDNYFELGLEFTILSNMQFPTKFYQSTFLSGTRPKKISGNDRFML